jgi:hypothetical protein
MFLAFKSFYFDSALIALLQLGAILKFLKLVMLRVGMVFFLKNCDKCNAKTHLSNFITKSLKSYLINRQSVL